jgi:hypothetical protein
MGPHLLITVVMRLILYAYMQSSIMSWVGGMPVCLSNGSFICLCLSFVCAAKSGELHVAVTPEVTAQLKHRGSRGVALTPQVPSSLLSWPCWEAAARKCHPAASPIT